MLGHSLQRSKGKINFMLTTGLSRWQTNMLWRAPKALKDYQWGSWLGRSMAASDKQGINSTQKKSAMDFLPTLPSSVSPPGSGLAFKTVARSEFLHSVGRQVIPPLFLSPSVERWLSFFLLRLFRSTSLQSCSRCSDTVELRRALLVGRLLWHESRLSARPWVFSQRAAAK